MNMFLPAQRVHLYCIEMVRYSDPHCSFQCLGGKCRGGQCRLEANVFFLGDANVGDANVGEVNVGEVNVIAPNNESW